MPEPIEYESGVYRRLQEIITARESRIKELEEALEEIGCRTPHAGHPNRTDCPICLIVDRVITK